MKDDVTERLLISVRRQLAEAEAELGMGRAKIANLEENLRLRGQHTDNLENLAAALQRRIGELDEQCAHLTRSLAARDRELGPLRQAQSRLRSVESSFSWQVTAPLRLLRRKLIDRRPNK